MGGNALKNTTTKRFSKKDFEKIERDVLSILINSGVSADTIPAFSDKESFGDLDILVSFDNNINYYELIQTLFSPSEVFCTDMSRTNKDGKIIISFNDFSGIRVISFDYFEFQIDLILMNPSDFHSARIYYSYNDLGNLMGRIARSFGTKYGHDGLSIVACRYNETYLGTISLSKNPYEIFDFLGYDYRRFCDGFTTLDNVFDFVISTPYFNSEVFLLENRNHKGRSRDSKRPSYRAFLERCKTLDNKHDYKFDPVRKNYYDRISDYFPSFKSEYNNLVTEYDKNIIIKRKINGFIVSEVTGLKKGVELGLFLNHLKSFDFYNSIADRSEKEILRFISSSFINYALHRTIKR